MDVTPPNQISLSTSDGQRYRSAEDRPNFYSDATREKARGSLPIVKLLMNMVA
jgi:hypothetical protein